MAHALEGEIHRFFNGQRAERRCQHRAHDRGHGGGDPAACRAAQHHETTPHAEHLAEGPQRRFAQPERFETPGGSGLPVDLDDHPLKFSRMIGKQHRDRGDTEMDRFPVSRLDGDAFLGSETLVPVHARSLHLHHSDDRIGPDLVEGLPLRKDAVDPEIDIRSPRMPGNEVDRGSLDAHSIGDDAVHHGRELCAVDLPVHGAFLIILLAGHIRDDRGRAELSPVRADQPPEVVPVTLGDVTDFKLLVGERAGDFGGLAVRGIGGYHHQLVGLVL